jgi:hypothetical protein
VAPYNECASDWCSSEEGVVDAQAVCLALVEDGDMCDESKHCLSGYCSTLQSNTCVTQQPEGGACYFTDECISGASLSCCWECGFTCEVYPRAVDQPCFSNSDCNSNFCLDYVCTVLVANGQSCTSNSVCSSG